MPTNKLATLKTISAANHVQCLRPENERFLIQTIQAHPEWQTVLEIGTGCGYSAFVLSQCINVKSVLTLEREPKRAKIATELLANAPKVRVLNVDARTYVPTQTFDVILIDGPKLHSWALFLRYEQIVNKNGAIFIDNLWLNNLRAKAQTRHERILVAADNLLTNLNNLSPSAYTLTIDPTGDGMACVQIHSSGK